MKIAALLSIVILICSCELQISITPANARFASNTFQGTAKCDHHISLDSSIMLVVIDRPFNDEDIEIDLGDGLLFDGNIDDAGVITIDNTTRQRASNGEAIRMTNGILEPGFLNDLDFTFYVSENNGQRGMCTVELDRI